MATGLSNRLALETYLEDRIKIYEHGQRGLNSLYLIMMDVNHFKRINDNYGHPEGDRALRTVSDVLKEIADNYAGDIIFARFGGDEFCAVFEAKSEHAVKQLCALIKKTLVDKSEHLKYRLGISAGYAEYTGKGMRLGLLYEEADKALYEDKCKMNGQAN